jgi:ferredoxin--NADP+ reductase
MNKIIEKEWLSSNIIRLRLESEVSQKCKPGQFVIIRVSELGERIPLTIYNFDKSNNYIELVFQVVGVTTEKLSKLETGDFVLDLLGPLGTPVEKISGKKVLAIAGGLGIAPLLSQVKHISNSEIDTIYGARNRESLVLMDKLKEASQVIEVYTDDGSFGQKGRVTDNLNNLLAEKEYDQVLAIGPVPMMAAVSEITKMFNVPTRVSLNPIMVDGTGMCGGCRVTVANVVKFACVDGPDFDGHLVNFSELGTRLNMFNDRGHKCVIKE